MVAAGASGGSPASGPMTAAWPSRSPRSPPPGRTCARKRRWTPSSSGGMSGLTTPKTLVCRPDRSSAVQADTASPPRQHVQKRRPCTNVTSRTAGNGSLMRTAPVALAYLDDEAALVEAARAVSELTHYDPEAGDACVLWCLAIRHAILTGLLDARIGLQHIDSDRRDLVGLTAGCRRGVPAFGLRQQWLGGRGAAGRMVGDRDYAYP